MYYRADLAYVHDHGFGDHAERCAPGILALLEPIRDRSGLVVELGCGSGALTRHLVAAGHDVVATDGSDAMLALARDAVPGADIRRLRLPGDPIPEADAIVSVGHLINYLGSADEIAACFASMAGALRPGGVLALDVCDLEWAAHRRAAEPQARVGEDYAIFTEYEVPSPDRFVRHITTFVEQDDGSWRRDHERHENVMVDTISVADRLEQAGVQASVEPSFGDESLPVGLVTVVGRKV